MKDRAAAEKSEAPSDDAADALRSRVSRAPSQWRDAHRRSARREGAMIGKLRGSSILRRGLHHLRRERRVLARALLVTHVAGIARDGNPRPLRHPRHMFAKIISAVCFLDRGRARMVGLLQTVQVVGRQVALSVLGTLGLPPGISLPHRHARQGHGGVAPPGRPTRWHSGIVTELRTRRRPMPE